MDASQSNRDRAAEVAAAPAFFNQTPDLLKFVLNNPPDRVTYGELQPLRAEFDELMQLALEAGIIKRPIGYGKYMDESFVRDAQPVPITRGK